MLFSAFSYSNESAENFFLKLQKINTYNEEQHLVVTKFTNNNNLNLFNHENILYIAEHSTIENQNKLKIIKMLSLIDQLIKKRQDIYSLSSNISTYNVMKLTVEGETSEDIRKSLNELYKVINELDNNVILGIREIQNIFKDQEQD